MRKLLVVLSLVALTLPGFAQVTFRIANGSEPESLDPHRISAVPSHRIYLSLFEGLMTPGPTTSNPVPGVAESYSVSKDNTVYTFKLRAGNVWSDGVPITAQTVVRSWLRCLNPDTQSEYASMLTEVIKGAKAYNQGTGKPEEVAIRAVDDLTFQFTTIGPAPYALSMLTHYAFAVVPIHVIEKWGDDWVRPEHFVGNGPFVLKEWKPNDRLVVARNPRYWDAKYVKLDQVVFYPTDDLAAAYRMYLNGEVDWDANSPPPELMDEAAKRPDYVRVSQYGTYYYEFNIQKPPFNDVRVRKAFSMTVDRQQLVDKIARNGELPALSLVPPSVGFIAPKGVAEDVASARKLLAEAGYPDGKDFPKVTILYNTSARHKAIAEYLRSRWSGTLGVTVEIADQEFTKYLDTRRDGKMGGFELVRAGWVADYQDPSAFSCMFLSDNLDFNDPRYSNPKYDELVRKANTLTSSAERMRLYQQADKILCEDDLPIMPIYWYVTQNFIDIAKWGGWAPNPLDQHSLKYIYKKQPAGGGS